MSDAVHQLQAAWVSLQREFGVSAYLQPVDEAPLPVRVMLHDEDPEKLTDVDAGVQRFDGHLKYDVYAEDLGDFDEGQGNAALLVGDDTLAVQRIEPHRQSPWLRVIIASRRKLAQVLPDSIREA